MAVVSDGEEAVARAQFKKLGWGEELFELIVGADSGARGGLRGGGEGGRGAVACRRLGARGRLDVVGLSGG